MYATLHLYQAGAGESSTDLPRQWQSLLPRKGTGYMSSSRPADHAGVASWISMGWSLLIVFLSIRQCLCDKESFGRRPHHQHFQRWLDRVATLDIMEYDKVTAKGEPEAKNYAHSSVEGGNNGGRLRVKGPGVDVSPLSDSITFPYSGRTAKNRFLKAPMTERLCLWNKDGEDISARGFPSEEYTRLYERWGEGEIGIIVAGNVMLRYDALEAYGNPILPDNHDGRVEAFRKVAEGAKKHGSLFIAQLSHPGRQGGAALNPNPVSASDVQLKIAWAGNTFNPPRALTVPEIKDLVKQWGEVAFLCYQAGFDGVQVHMAHGYLLAQFLSLTTNKRFAFKQRRRTFGLS